ncbi:MAG: 5'-3' exonuclease [Chloroflexi bacterium]|nr:5'-3' exonuclease [Chloroflexota bacterium]MDA1219027.1 5'-3' exonuclease [Chloroflexota bacterium]PKB57448.1 MAG: flap endonuclease [SAR202 cluster bacterium Casp-Chloro-G3]
MKLHLVDGTYELFRAYYGVPSIKSPDGREVGAIRGLIQTLLMLLRQDDVTHVGCAFDSVVESFRNQMFEGYKTGAGMPADILSQFELAERAAVALGLVVWPMTEFEADDVIATAAARWQNDPPVEQVVICSVDKDLCQMVRDAKVVELDRRRGLLLDEDGVREKFGVSPQSIPDYLALVGDDADGIPGIPKWGSKTSAHVLAHYRHIENIPDDSAEWSVPVRGAKGVADSLAQRRAEAALYKKLATLRLDVPISETLADLEWPGVRRADYGALCGELGLASLKTLPHRWAEE